MRVFDVNFLDKKDQVLHNEQVHHIDSSRNITLLYVCDRNEKVIRTIRLPYKLNDVYAFYGRIIFSFAGGLRLDARPIYDR